MSALGRPQQKKQPSRKGKKAWRKNIDVEDVEQGLEERRDEIITFGEHAQEVAQEQLFTVDVSGDAKLTKKAVKPYKVTKSSEILAQRSKAPGFHNAHKKSDNKIGGVKKKEIHRLMKLAGRVQGETQIATIIAKEGVVTTKAYDVWGDDEPVQKKSKKKSQPTPEILEKFSTAGWTKAKHAPSTITHAPLHVKQFEAVPHAGKSYNPSLEDWKSLIQREFTTEKEKDDQRQQLEEHKRKIQHLIDTLDDKEEEDLDDDDDEEEEQVDEDADEEEATSLSLNKPVVLKKKTKHQRNREKRHLERMALQQELKDLKHHIHELQKLPLYEQQVADEVSKEHNFDHEKDLVAKRHKLGTRHKVEDTMVEVKLSDELTDSLRKLKTEGNLFYDHMRSMQSKGKIETRKPVKQKRRYLPKVTEKWTYKDFK